MYAPQQPPPQNSSYNNYNNSYFGAPNANFGIQATGIFGPQAQPPSNASMNQVNFVDFKQITHDSTENSIVLLIWNVFSDWILATGG